MHNSPPIKPINYIRKYLFLASLFILHVSETGAADYYVKGRVTDPSGMAVAGAKVSMAAGSTGYAALTDFNGNYSLRISGVYSDIEGFLEPGVPYPNPFTYSACIPFMINSQGTVNFAVYTYSGRKIKEFNTPRLDAGSYRISWDGRSDNGAPAGQGFYIYTLTFRGKTWSGRIIKASRASSYSAGTTVETVMMPPLQPPSSGTPAVAVVTNVTFPGYYPATFSDIVIRRDTVIDFEIAGTDPVPFRTSGEHIAMYDGISYRGLFLKGINLGSSPPGTFPGEIAYAISPDRYDEWIKRIALAGFNSIRIYTLHPPAFYEKLANYNNRHPGKPLLLFQGIWLDEIERSYISAEYDLTLRTSSFTLNIREVIDCMHGNRNIPFRPGRSYGSYTTDISRWIAGFIIGREISPHEVDSTNSFHPSLSSYSGSAFSISGASATEVFITQMLDETASYEEQKYNTRRPLSISSWPTLDPLSHPDEPDPDEDMASFDISKITFDSNDAGVFATYHAYPYYPGFVSDDPYYRSFSDEEGPNSYLGYISGLRDHYSGIPLVIGEFGVPSSWGSAFQSFSSMNHGGYSEKQQGEKNLRMLGNILNAGCAGGFMFSWMDEWFKPTWIVSMLEAYGFDPGGGIVPTRQLWHNITSPEQNFGLIAFDQKEIPPFVSYGIDNQSAAVKLIEATHDNAFFRLGIEMKETILPGDTIIIAFDTYSSDKGESRLPNGRLLNNRSEFILEFVAGSDTANYFVTEAYNMSGMTVRFNVSDPLVRKYRSIATDGAPWNPVRWINNAFTLAFDETGRLPAENSAGFTNGERRAVAWSGNKISVRIPWTLLHFYDPSQMKVIDGAESNDGGITYNIIAAASDGIAVSLYSKGSVVSATDRYNWDKWLIVPEVVPREKESLHVVESGLGSVAGFTD